MGTLMDNNNIYKKILVSTVFLEADAIEWIFCCLEEIVQASNQFSYCNYAVKETYNYSILLLLAPAPIGGWLSSG